MVKTIPRYNRNRLKALREFSQLSHEAFGQKIGRTKQTVISWEKGRTVPDVLDLETIAKAFKVNPTSFWTHDEEK